jgi:hypothetical protein
MIGSCLIRSTPNGAVFCLLVNYESALELQKLQQNTIIISQYQD